MKALTVALLVGAMMALTAATGASKNETMSSSEGHDSEDLHLCRGGWTLYGDRCFLIVQRVLTWPKAEKNCLQLGANLASVTSPDEYHAIQAMIASKTLSFADTWLGGSDAQEEGSWFWSDGTLFSFQDWCPGEPNNVEVQHCLQMNHGVDKCWDNVECHRLRPSVCAKKLG